MIYITGQKMSDDDDDDDDLLDDNVNIVGISSFINSNSNIDIREIERSIVENDESVSITKENDNDIFNEFNKRIASIESSIGVPLNDSDEPESILRSNSDDMPRASLYRHNNSGPENSSRQQYSDPKLNKMSSEQIKQRDLQRALESININTSSQQGENGMYNLDAEKMRDKKDMLLGQIDLLRQSLEDEGRKTSDILVVTNSNTFEEVESVYKQLRYRNDHVRYCSVANEFAQTLAYGLEWAFDGKRSYFGFQPDMTGWDATLNIKMRHLSYETSSMVSDSMKSYNLGNFWRLLLELVPSAVLHSKMKKNKSGNKKRDLNNAIGRIRDMDDMK
jgi:hypothetical protein